MEDLAGGLRRLFRRRPRAIQRGRRLAAGYRLQPHADMLDAGLVERVARRVGSRGAGRTTRPRSAHSSTAAPMPAAAIWRSASSISNRPRPRPRASRSTATRARSWPLPAAPRASAACRGAAVDERQEMRGRCLVLVDLLVERHALLVDEHRRADREAGLPARRVGSFPDERASWAAAQQVQPHGLDESAAALDRATQRGEQPLELGLDRARAAARAGFAPGNGRGRSASPARRSVL